MSRMNVHEIGLGAWMSILDIFWLCSFVFGPTQVNTAQTDNEWPKRCCVYIHAKLTYLLTWSFTGCLQLTLVVFSQCGTQAQIRVTLAFVSRRMNKVSISVANSQLHDRRDASVNVMGRMRVCASDSN